MFPCFTVLYLPEVVTVRAEVKFKPECADIFTSETVRKIHDKKMLVFKFCLANKVHENVMLSIKPFLPKLQNVVFAIL